MQREALYSAGPEKGTAASSPGRYDISTAAAQSAPPHRLLAACAFAAALLAPHGARAAGLGDIALQSRLGEPLLAQVELLAADGENIDDACLSLAAPDPADDEARSYLLNARLEIRGDGARRYIVIRSRKTLDDLFVKLRLRIKCPGMGAIVKTYTLLPDLGPASAMEAARPDEPAEPPRKPAAAVSDAAPVTAMPAGAAPAAAGTTQAEGRRGPSARPASAGAAKPATRPAPAPAERPSPPESRRKAPAQQEFRLKLSAAPIDASRIGKISPEEREQLLAQQKLLDADDQTARFLALQHQVRQLQDELGDIKLRLAQMEGTQPAGAASSAAAGAPAPVAAVRKPPQKIVVREDPLPLGTLLAAALALLAAAGLLLGLRRYTRLKSREAALPVSRQSGEPVLPVAAAAPAAVRPPPPSAPQAAAPQPEIRPAQPVAQPVAAEENTQDAPDREEAMLEEAELYSLHGHARKALEILGELLAHSPAHARARMRQLSILSSLGMAQEFERAAHAFREHRPDGESWKLVQTLGRTLDAGNPLYADADGAPPPVSGATGHRRIGEILVDMGALSVQDLENCLADFDPQTHGRLGGYLIARKAITFDQLNAALQQQEEDRAAAPAETEMRTGLEAASKPDTHEPLEFEPVKFKPASDDSIPLELDFMTPAPPAAPAPAQKTADSADDPPIPLFLKLDLEPADKKPDGE